MEIKDLATQLEKNATEIKAAQTNLENEIKSQGEATVETKAALEAAKTEQTELKSKFDDMDKKLIELQLEQKRIGDRGATNEVKTAGSLFIESPVFETLKKTRRGSNEAVVIEKKDITSLADSAGALVDTQRDPTVYRNPNRPTRIRDLIPSFPVTSGAYEFMRQNVFTNNAAPQGTVAGLGGGEFVSKAKSNITWELVSKTIKTIPHWMPASRQVLSDAGQLKGLIDIDLEYGLDLESDNQLLLGDGTGQNMTGLLVDADVSDIGELDSSTADADIPSAMIDHIRKAVTQCQINEYYNVNGIVMNPQDWATLETAKATDGHYLMISMPAQGADPVIWRMPVIVTNAMPVSYFILGDWTMGAKIYDRQSKEIRVSESHGDYFVQNGVAILAEERYDLAVPRPKAFTKGQFTVASA